MHHLSTRGTNPRWSSYTTGNPRAERYRAQEDGLRCTSTSLQACGLFLGGLDVIADGGCWSLLTADEELNYAVNIQRWQTEAEEAAREYDPPLSDHDEEKWNTDEFLYNSNCAPLRHARSAVARFKFMHLAPRQDTADA